VRTGGKQYRVELDQLLDVDRLPADVGSFVEITDVLLVRGDVDVQVGTPLVDGARVVAEVVEHGRGEKILVFKYKAKTRYRRRRGHRQDYTRLAIRRIEAGGEAAAELAVVEAKPQRQRRAKAAAEEPAGAVAVGEPPAAEAEAKPRRQRRAKAATAEVGEPVAVAEPPAVEAEAKPRRQRRAKAAEPPEAAAVAEEQPAAAENESGE